MTGPGTGGDRPDGPPAWVRRVCSTLPPEFRDEVLEDLHADAVRRGLAGRRRAHLWYARALMAPSMLALVWRLRRRYPDPAAGPAAWSADLRHAVRGLRRDPWFTVAAVAVLTLGIGATIGVVGVAHAVLLRPPPYEEPEALAFVWNRLDGFESDRLPLSGIQVAELRAERAVFEDVAGVWATTRTVSLDDGSVLVPSATVTPNVFTLLGVTPALGPGFGPDEGDDGESTVMVSHGFWSTELGADPAVVGRSLRVDGSPATVVGVLPRTFRFVFPDGVGVPATVEVVTVYPWAAAGDPTGPRFLRGVARIRAGVEPEAVDRGVEDVAGRLRARYEHMAASGDRFHAVPLARDATESARPLLLALVAGVALFLLLTFVNVTSLAMARRAGRSRELAIRRSLGASAGRVRRLLLVEVGLLSAAGAVLGGLAGHTGMALLWRLRPRDLAGVDGVATGLEVMAMAGGLLVLTLVATAAGALIGGSVPSPALLGAPRTVGRRAMRPRRVVVACELALGVILAVGATLMGMSVARLGSVDLGFRAADVRTFRVGISNQTFPSDGERARLASEVAAALEALPGVRAVGATSHLPLADWANWSGTAAPVDAAPEQAEAYHFGLRSVTPGYFDALGVPVRQGRGFGTADTRESDPVVVVDDDFARRAFPGEAVVVGREVVVTRYVDRQFVPERATIVGVVAAVRDRDPTRPSAGQVFWPYAQSPRWELSFAVAGGATGERWGETVRAAVASVHRDLAVADVRPLDDYVREATGPLRFAALLATLFSVLAIAQAALGLHGVMSYAIRQRVGEIGVRLVLGARSADVFAAVVREGLVIGAAGVGTGLVGAWGLARFLDALLYEVDPLDPRVLGAVGALLLLVAALSTAVPAARAARLDPAETLRTD